MPRQMKLLAFRWGQVATTIGANARGCIFDGLFFADPLSFYEKLQRVQTLALRCTQGSDRSYQKI